MKDEDKTKIELIKELKFLREEKEKGVFKNITERKQAEEKTRQKTEDLTLINTLNDAVNRGGSLLEILQLLARETKRIFSCHGATVYLLSEDREYLVMQIFNRPPAMISRIEKLIGKRIPGAISIPLKAGSLYRKVLQGGKPQLINDPKTIQGLMAECTENKILKKLVPKIYPILDIRSVISVPLVSKGKAIGLLDVSRKEPFTEFDLKRFETISGQVTSIIEHKQLEEALKESEKKLRVLFENSYDLISLTDANANTLWANPQWKKVFGLESGYNADVFTNIHPDDREKAAKYWQNLISNKATIKDYQYRYKLPNGIYSTFESSAFPVVIDKEKFYYVIARDITERKQAEKEIKESEERLKILFDYAPDAYYISDLKGRFVDGNIAAERVIGYKKEELIGKNFLKLKLLSLADIPKAAKLLAKNLRRLPTGPDEFVLNRKDNSKVTVEISTYPVKIKGRALALGIARDITERKQSEEKLTIITERLELAMDAGEHGFWDWNLDTDDVYFSPRYYTMLGYEPGELPMKKETWVGLMHPEDQKTIVPKVEKHVANAEPYEIEFRLKTKGGDWKWISGSGKSYNIDKNGISHRAIGIHVDITERKKAEERLRNTMYATIQTMSKIVEVKDPYTAGHQQRVSQLTTAIAKELNLSPDKIEGIRIASLIHDIGKIGVPTEILSKTTTLSDIEFSLIKEHSRIGYDILKSIDFSYPVARIVLQHHEKINGSGYPNKLKGDEILLEAKILGVADVVEAMSSHRPYRPALGIDVALEEISKNRRILYDQKVVDACLKLFKEKGFKFE